MAKKSILYIITKSVWGGAAKYVYDLSNNLSKENFDVYVAAGGKGEFAQKIKQANIPYFEIKSFQRNINIFKEFIAAWEIFFILLKTRPDIIHVNSSKAGGIAGWVARKYQFLTFRKIHFIFTAHGWAFNEDRPKWQIYLIKLLSKITCLFYNKIICVSEYDRRKAIENKIAPAKKLITIYNGIDIKNLNFLPKEQAQQKLLNKTSPFVIGTIAEWTKNKGIIYLLKAIKDIEKKKIDIVLIGNGENPNKEKIYNYIKKNNLKNIYLHEYIPNAASYLKAFDIFVLPSVKEGLPYTILEAMAAKIPIISTTVGGIPEIYSSVFSKAVFEGCPCASLLVQPKDSQQLADKINYLLNNLEFAKSLAEKAYQKLEQEFSLEKMIQETKKIY